MKKLLRELLAYFERETITGRDTCNCARCVKGREMIQKIKAVLPK